jgi:hypothetical protein
VKRGLTARFDLQAHRGSRTSCSTCGGGPNGVALRQQQAVHVQKSLTATITASTSSANVLLPAGDGNQIRITTLASIVVYIDFGGSAVTTAVSTGIPIPTGAYPEKFAVDTLPILGGGNQQTYMAVIVPAVTANAIYIVRGDGY